MGSAAAKYTHPDRLLADRRLDRPHGRDCSIAATATAAGRLRTARAPAWLVPTGRAPPRGMNCALATTAHAWPRERARSHRSGVVGHDQLSRRRRVCGRGVVVERHRGPGGWQLSGWRCRGFWFCGACLGMRNRSNLDLDLRAPGRLAPVRERHGAEEDHHEHEREQHLHRASVPVSLQAWCGAPVGLQCGV